jgi:hypothetical protein
MNERMNAKEVVDEAIDELSLSEHCTRIHQCVPQACMNGLFANGSLPSLQRLCIYSGVH